MKDKLLLFKASILVDDLLKINSPELFDESDVAKSKDRVSSEGGMLAYAATVQDEIKEYFTAGT